MKNFYTVKELQNLTEEELLELTTFGGSDKIYYYSDLDSIEANNDEFSFSFKNKTEEVYTQSEEKFLEVKAGKARFDLITKSLDQVNSDKDKMTEFMNQISVMVDTKLQEITDATLKTQDSIQKNVQKVTDNAQVNSNNVALTVTRAVEKIEKNSDDVSKTVTNKLNGIAKLWETQINNLKDVDTEAYNIKMVKIESILEAFDKLLEE